MIDKLLEKLLGQAGRAGDIAWDADMRLVMPARDACAAWQVGQPPGNVIELASRRQPATAPMRAAARRASS